MSRHPTPDHTASASRSSTLVLGGVSIPEEGQKFWPRNFTSKRAQRSAPVSTRHSTSWAGGMERGRASARSIQCRRWRTGRYVDRACLPGPQRRDCGGRVEWCLGNADGTTDCACICGVSWSAVGVPEGDGAAEGFQRELGLPPRPPGGVQAACVRDTPRQILLQRSACTLQAPLLLRIFVPCGALRTWHQHARMIRGSSMRTQATGPREQSVAWQSPRACT